MEISFEGGKVVTAYCRGHLIRTDQPEGSGGKDSAPSPFELYLASIGTCAGIYVKSFCDNRNIPAEKIKLVETVKYDKDSGLPVSVEIEIRLPPEFPEKYRESVIHVAELCKVKKSIMSPPQFTIKAVQAD
jgi:putative redox protein